MFGRHNLLNASVELKSEGDVWNHIEIQIQFVSTAESLTPDCPECLQLDVLSSDLAFNPLPTCEPSIRGLELER